MDLSRPGAPVVQVVGINIPARNPVFVERKGIGHPDTLADHLAELLSQRYAQFTARTFGAVLHHNFDKSGLLGGKSSVGFGRGYLTAPIRVLINGRVSINFGSQRIDYEELLTEAVYDFFAARFGDLVPRSMLAVEFNISTASSPGHSINNNRKGSARSHWFTPRGFHDLPELSLLLANDTSLGCGFAPLHPLERFVIDTEAELTGGRFASDHAWLGSDIKIMASEVDGQAELTACIPQIANHVSNIEAYKANLCTVQAFILERARSELGVEDIGISINTRDNFTAEELYLTAIGSAIESGDEGLAGRGNRVNQVISVGQPISMEGASGKNPVYHVGKLYYVAAQSIAEAIYKKFSLYNEVYIVSQSGRKLVDPWKTVVKLGKADLSKTLSDHIRELVISELEKLPQLTNEIICGKRAIA